MPKLQQMGNGSKFVTIPKDILKKLAWKTGDTLLITLNEPGKLKVEKI